VLILAESSVEGQCAGREIDPFDEGARFGGTHFAVHAAVFPFYRQRPVVTDIVQSPDDIFKIDTAAADASEVPVPAAIAEIKMPSEDSGCSGMFVPSHIFHVNVEDSFAKNVDELCIVDSLVSKMAWIKIKTESRMIVD